MEMPHLDAMIGVILENAEQQSPGPTPQALGMLRVICSSLRAAAHKDVVALFGTGYSEGHDKGAEEGYERGWSDCRQVTVPPRLPDHFDALEQDIAVGRAKKH